MVAWLADGLGEMVAELTVDRLDIYEEIFRLERRLNFQNPLESMRFIGKIQNCIFPVFGQYQVLLVVEHELIAHRKFTLRKKRKPS